MTLQTFLRHTLLWGLSLSCHTIVLATPFYHWTDEQGHPVYSDQPKGATRLTQWPQALPSQAEQNLNPPLISAPSISAYRYQKISLKSYHTEQHRQRIIRVQITPALHKNHKVALYLNQKPYQSALHSQSFLLHQLPTGRHKLIAIIKDANHRNLIVSPALHLEIQN